MEAKRYWGIDLGGTKIEGAIFTFEDNHIQIIDRRRVPTEAKKGYQHICNQILKLVEEMKSNTGSLPKSIGFSTPGAVEPSTQLMKNCNTTCLNDMPLQSDLEKALNIPIKIANDANCFAIAETTLGVVKNKVPHAEVVFGVIMGTGCGGGLVVHQKVISGHHGIGGEWGHNFLDESGGQCYCGSVGCVEKIISGTGLENFYEAQTGYRKTMRDIYKDYKAETDPIAAMTMQRLFEMFGKAISVIINTIDPDAIVIGGGLGNIDEIYTYGVEEIKKHIFNNRRVTTPFLKPELGDSAGVFGAGLL